MLNRLGDGARRKVVFPVLLAIKLIEVLVPGAASIVLRPIVHAARGLSGAAVSNLAVTQANEEVDEYTEWLESRQALLDAALQVETVAAGRLQKVAHDLLDGSASAGTDGADGSTESGAADAGAPDETIDVARVESYLLERLDALRHVSYAGSVPLVIDDATLTRGLDILATAFA